MKRKDAVELYAILRELKNGGMGRECLTAFILMRMSIKSIFDEFEKARIEISEATKPEGFKEGDNVHEWENAFRDVMDKWLNTDVEGIDTHVLSCECFVELVTKNDLSGGVQDMLFERIVKHI